MSSEHPAAEIAVITGVGQAGAIATLPSVAVNTPFGPTSEEIRIGEVHGRPVAFLARRATGERLPPHRVPYRANIWALASIGVRSLITSTGSRGLREAFSAGTFAVTDQFIDLTSGRDATFFDHLPVQLEVADPFDPTLRELSAEALRRQGVRVRDFGTAVVRNGPRGSTRAETRSDEAAGGDFTNMTLLPEATLARELDIAVVNITFITDRADTPDDLHGMDHLNLMRLRAQQAQNTLQHALYDLIRTIPTDYRPPPSESTRFRDALLAK